MPTITDLICHFHRSISLVPKKQGPLRRALLPRAGSILIDEVKDLAVVSIVATLVDVAILVVVTDLQVVAIKTGTITLNVMSTMLKIITMMMTIWPTNLMNMLT